MAGSKALPRRLPRPSRLPLVGGLPSLMILRRLAAVIALLAIALVALYFLWFRHSSFVTIEEVQIHGAEESVAVAITLDEAARGMSALDLDVEALRAAVADDPTVRGLTAEPALFHAVRIDVELRLPAGVIGGEDGVVVADDGVVLPGFDSEGLPLIDAETSVVDGPVEGDALELAKALGPAPTDLRKQIEVARVDKEHGLVIGLEGGIELRFGDSSQAEEKWAAAATVLADPKLKSATYLDLMVPNRPVSGTG